MDHRLYASSELTCLYLSDGTKGPFLHPAVLERNEADAKCWQNLGELESSRVTPPPGPAILCPFFLDSLGLGKKTVMRDQAE